MGTATTFTVVNEKRQVIGGMILPGVGVALDSLTNRTSQLPKISLEPPKKLIGSNTVDCMKSGVLYGNACCVCRRIPDGACHRRHYGGNDASL